MPLPAPTDPALERKLLFIEHLASRMLAMETGRMPVHAVAYRLYMKRLRAAAAGVTDRDLARMSGGHPVVTALLAERHYDSHGRLPGTNGRSARNATDKLLLKLRTATA